MVDMAHYSGLIAAECISPIPHADLATSTTLNTTRTSGWNYHRKKQFEKPMNSALFQVLKEDLDACDSRESGSIQRGIVRGI